MGLKESYEWVHQAKDAAVKVLPGSQHRKYGHDPAFNLLLAAVSGDPIAFLVGTKHDLEDRAVSKLPLQARKLLEGMVK
jgi:hypothetical protein